MRLDVSSIQDPRVRTFYSLYSLPDTFLNG